MKIDVEAHKMRIGQSHERCINHGINSGRVFSKKILEGDELSRKLEEKKELILTATPFMNFLYNFVKGSDFFAIITDEEGCILNVIGDKGIVDEAIEYKMIPGAYMDEESIGTNAMSLVLTSGEPIQLSHKDHYIEAYYKWTCSCAPIKGIDGKIIGTIDLTGYTHGVHPHTLGMVVAAARSIEKIFETKNYNETLNHNNKHIKNILNSISRGIMAIDLSGTIKTTNEIVAEMFGYSQSRMREMKIWDLVEGWQDILDALYSHKSFVDEDIYVNSTKNKVQMNVSAYPIYDSDRRIKEVIFLLQELKKSRKLARRISSGHAIYTFDKIIGKNSDFLKVIGFCNKVASSKSTILISGESGTGKEVFAQSIHNASDRKDEAFIAVNCGAIPRSLIESELFGYEEGAFTGAKRGGCPGKFELADGGTIFLDEIGEMSLDMQTKLLRVIEEKVINRIGGRNPLPVNVRIIAATNKDLKEEVEKGNFRNDLYYRLNVLPVYLPLLKERRDDIPRLIEFFMDTISKRLNKKRVDIPKEYMQELMKYDWPGNIRELENVIELIINTESIPLNISKRISKSQIKMITIEDDESNLEYVEKKHILKVLMKANGNVSAAAKLLGIGRNTIYRKLEKYEIDPSTLK